MKRTGLLKEHIKQSWRIITDRKNFWFPSSLSYYLVLAMIPVIYLIEFALALFKLPQSILSTYIGLLIPSNNQDLFQNFLGTRQPSDFIALAIALALSFNVVAGGIRAFLLINDRVYNLVRENEKRQSKSRRSKSYKLTLLLLLGIVIFSVVLIAVNHLFIVRLKLTFFEYLTPLIMIIFILPLLTFFYYLSPDKKQKLKNIFPGAIIATLGVILTLFIFELLTSSFINFNTIYGPLSYLVSLLILCYFVSYSLFIGLAVNAVNICQLVEKNCQIKRK